MKKTTAYEAEDGRQFATKEEALAYESGLAMTVFLNRILPETAMGDVAAIVDAIRADPTGASEAFKTLQPKRTRADMGVKRGPRAGTRAAPKAA